MGEHPQPVRRAVCLTAILAGLAVMGLLLAKDRKRTPSPEEIQRSIPVQAPGKTSPDKTGAAQQESSVAAEEPVVPTVEDKVVAQTTPPPRRLPGEPATPPPIPSVIPEPPEPVMGWATATISIGDKTVTPKNVFGHFPPIRAGAGEKVSIHVSWPKAKPGTPVAIEVPNMGILDNGSVSKLSRVNAQGQIAFEYTTSANPGMCLVVLRSGFEETSFEFWVPSGLPGYDGPFGGPEG